MAKIYEINDIVPVIDPSSFVGSQQLTAHMLAMVLCCNMQRQAA